MLYQHISLKKFHAQASFPLSSQITFEFSNKIYYPVFSEIKCVEWKLPGKEVGLHGLVSEEEESG